MKAGLGSDGLIWLAAVTALISAGAFAWRAAQRLQDVETEVVVPAEREVVQIPSASIDDIIALMPFGRPEVSPASEDPAPSDVPMSLLGIVRASPPARSSAIISAGTAPAKRFFAGDRVAQDVRLVEIQEDQVLLEVGGRNQVLSLMASAQPMLPPSDSVARRAGAATDLDALRDLIFDQVNGQGQPSADVSSGRGLQE
jgi:hypothetical protein